MFFFLYKIRLLKKKPHRMREACVMRLVFKLSLSLGNKKTFSLPLLEAV